MAALTGRLPKAACVFKEVVAAALEVRKRLGDYVSSPAGKRGGRAVSCRSTAAPTSRYPTTAFVYEKDLVDLLKRSTQKVEWFLGYAFSSVPFTVEGRRDQFLVGQGRV